MKVIAIGERKNDFPVAVIKLHETLRPEFAAEVKALPAWEKQTDEELLETQTFVAWIRTQSWYADKTLQECLENDSYSWSDTLTVQEL